MKEKKNWIITIILLAFVIAFVQVTQVAGKSEQKVNTRPQTKATIEPREILAGLQGVGVVVEDFRPEVEKYGFNREQYQTDVELRLRQYGVRILSKEESYKVSGSPYLYINVKPVLLENSLAATVGISVEFNEFVFLRRNPSIITFATTWNKGMTLLYGLNRLDEVRDGVRDLVDMFINDYLAANPKDQPSKAIQQTYVVPKNALIDMQVCPLLLIMANDPNLPPEQKVSAVKNGLGLLGIQGDYLKQLGLGYEDILARFDFLTKGDIKDMPAEFFDYINVEDLRKALNKLP